MSTPTIDFSKINNHGKNPESSFEDLAFALFKREMEKRGEVVTRYSDKGGDGGVEAISQSGVALQAKYIFTASKTGGLWQQLEKSVCQAYRTYGDKLTEYHIYAPCDLRGQATQHEGEVEKTTTWEHYVKKWAQWFKKGIPANKRKEKKGTEEYEWEPTSPNREIKFVFRGNGDLMTALLEEDNRHIAEYWFNAYNLTKNTLEQKFNEAKAHIDVKYSEANNIDTECKEKLINFCDCTQLKKKIRIKCNAISTLLKKLQRDSTVKDLSITSIDGDNIIDSFLNSYQGIHQEHEGIITPLLSFLDETDTTVQATPEQKLTIARGRATAKEIINQLYDLDSLCYSIFKANHSFLLLTGEAGSGKTHLLASLTKHLLKNNHKAIFIAASYLIESKSIEEGLSSLLGFEGSFEALLHYLNGSASCEDSKFIVIIDGINESSNPKAWKNFLSTISERLTPFKNIKLIISCKTEYQKICLPNSISKQRDLAWEHESLYLTHRDVASLISRYFSAYSIIASDVQQYCNFLHTPLELKLFCETYSGSCFKTSNPGLINFLEEWFRHKFTECAQAMDISESIVRNAIYSLARLMWHEHRQLIEKEKAETIIFQFSPSKHESDGLYQHLLGQGLIHESIKNNDITYVSFPYELLSNYIILKSKAETDQTFFEQNLEFIRKEPSLLMLSMLIYAKRGIELIASYNLTEEDSKSAFIRGLRLRGSSDFSASTYQIAKRYLPDITKECHIGDALSSLLQEKSPYNARHITEYLTSLAQAEQDTFWTIPIGIYNFENNQSMISDLHYDSKNIITYSKEKKILFILSSLLMFSSNNISLRNESIHLLSAAIETDNSLFTLAIEQLKQHSDQFIYEGAYAAFTGAIMKTSSHSFAKEVALKTALLYNDNALESIVCRRCIEIMATRALLIGAINTTEEQNIYHYCHGHSKKYTGLSKERIKELEQKVEWVQIVESTRTEKDGWYGDFGRYVMTSYISAFSEESISENPTCSRGDEVYDCSRARAVVLELVEKLGFCHELYAILDNRVTQYAGYSREPKPLIRIGKKYQEIALNILLASLDDYYKPLNRSWIHRRNFDARIPITLNDSEFIHHCSARTLPISIFQSSLKEVISSVQTSHDSFLKHITQINLKELICSKFADTKEDCLLLGGRSFTNRQWLEDSYNGIASCLNFGIRCWIIRMEEERLLCEYLKEKSFFGEGFAFGGTTGNILSLYPSEEIRDEENIKEDYWIRYPYEHRPISSCISLSGINEESEILVPTYPIMDMLHMSWDYSTLSFRGDSATARTYSINNNRHKALYISKNRFIQKLKKNGYIPIWAFWLEAYVFDYERGKVLYGGRKCREGILALNAQHNIKFIKKRTSTV